jgi:pre-mRNA-splicing factor CWC26
VTRRDVDVDDRRPQRARALERAAMSSKLDYLKKYMSAPSSADPRGDDGKKRKKKRPKTHSNAIRIIDGDAGASADATGTKKGREDEDRAVVLDARGREVDAAAMATKEIEARAVRYMGIGDDGSGWTAVEEDGSGGGGRRRRHDSDSEEATAAAAAPSRRARHDSDSEDDAGDASIPPEDAPTTSAGDGLQYDSDGDLIIPQEPAAAAAAAGEPQYDSDGDFILPEEPSGQQELQYDSDGDLILPPDPLPEAPAEDNKKKSKEKKTKEHKMTDGTSTGLVSAAQVIMEAELKRKAEQARVAKMTDEQSGRGAATNYRDKATGKLMDSEEMKRRSENVKPKERERPVWATGVEQARQAKQYEVDLVKAKDTPFAHADIDADYEDKQRSAMRFGDPMAHLSRKKRHAESLNLPSVVDGLGLSMDDLKKSGFRIPQEVPPHSWLRRGVVAPHNRYGIKPGRHWDGVDRGTGFEAKMFRKKSELKERAQLEDADAEEHNEWF